MLTLMQKYRLLGLCTQCNLYRGEETQSNFTRKVVTKHSTIFLFNLLHISYITAYVNVTCRTSNPQFRKKILLFIYFKTVEESQQLML